ncbi:MAG: hypothetical protein NWF10_03945 [Candidatus Bathyarchaeota archaeon]|jgi:hypothetical protein|nr:hypothetical protein [Candidatus Bathyarchaeota archaeon]
MSHKAKRKMYSESSSFERWLRKISGVKPSSFAITIILIAYAVFLFGGGLFTIVSPIFPPYTGSTFLFIYPELASQFISDTLIAATLYVWGFIGVLALYKSTKYAYKPREAYMWAIIGATLLLSAYFILEVIILQKTG